MSAQGNEPSSQPRRAVNTRQKGQLIEQLAEQFLTSQGLVLLKKNHQCRFGEIDLVMLSGTSLVFVEVRHRSNRGFGSGADSVTESKQQKLRITAEHYLQTHCNTPWPDCRFDVISAAGRYPDIQLEWIPDAF